MFQNNWSMSCLNLCTCLINGYVHTGLFKSNFDNFISNYDKLSMACVQKNIMVYLFSVYPDISFYNNKSEKIT